MKRPEKLLAVEKAGNVVCVRLLQNRIEDHEMESLGAELAHLVDVENARKIVFNLASDDPECLISMFLAKLLGLQRRLQSLGGSLALAQVHDDTRAIFRIAGVEKFFRFYPDQQAALQALEQAD